MNTAKFTKPLVIVLHPQIFSQIRRISDDEKTSIAEWVRVVVGAALLKTKGPEVTEYARA